MSTRLKLLNAAQASAAEKVLSPEVQKRLEDAIFDAVCGYWEDDEDDDDDELDGEDF